MVNTEKLSRLWTAYNSIVKVQPADLETSLDDLGISRQRLAEWREVRDAGADVIENAINEALSENRPPATAQGVDVATSLQAGTKFRQIEEHEVAVPGSPVTQDVHVSDISGGCNASATRSRIVVDQC
jgi:hypothetical protein